ncbi:nucleoside-triphosphatase [Flavonifractor plautii]|nr:nucleoside-triphosphatase [Flavonifractor plautii]
MDELGFLERCSPVFQRAVFTLLDGPTPVLGCCAATQKAPSGALFPAGRMSGCSR